MARKMRKFSAGGAQGKYDRRMADIEKDFKKDSAGKSGKALEVLEAKRAQRKADAEDDRAKRTGADRTATRAAEKAAESNLTKTRKYGAAKSVTQEKPTSEAKILDSFPTPKMDSSIGTSKPKAKPPVRRSAPVVRTDKGADTPVARTDKGATPVKNIAPSKFDAKAFADLKAKMPKPTVPAFGGTALRGKPGGTPLFRFGRDAANDPARAAKLAEMKRAAEAPGASGFAKSRYKAAIETGMYAKGGTVKKETTMKKPMPMGGKQLMPMKKKLPKEPITGGADTVPLTPNRKEFLKEMAKRNATPGMKKGGKMATKFGAAMVKKSADTKGRAMTKKAGGGKCYAAGGLVGGHKSADGIAKKGKTKGKMV